MSTNARKTREYRRHSISNDISQKKAGSEPADNRVQAKQFSRFRAMNSNPLQQRLPDQRKENKTGLPDHLKTGMESLSGYSMDDVKVHYNSGRPSLIQAHAYARGTDIYLAPGQERHLPHEAWHVVQQKQGRVRPTVQLKEKMNLNDDPGLEKEADTMGERAMAMRPKAQQPETVRAPLSGVGSPDTAQPKFDGSHAVIQARIKIGGQTYTHGSKRWVDHLFDSVVAPTLEQRGYKTYGAKSALVRFIKMYRDADPGKIFGDESEFLDEFIPWLLGQERNVRGGKKTSLIKPFEVSGMSRPGWPKDYATRLGSVAGDNIRHVIRNATIKRALKIDYDIRSGSFSDLRQHLQGLAGTLGVDFSESTTVDVLMKEIYKKLYLNIDNLFAGTGGTNQVIGFAADPVREFGEDLVAMGEEPVDVESAFGHVFGILDDVARRVRGDESEISGFVGDIKSLLVEIVENIKTDNRGSVEVPAEVVGNLLADVGLNFGFDLIDGRVAQDQFNIEARQARLLRVEGLLQEYISSEGTKGDLTSIFKQFMGL